MFPESVISILSNLYAVNRMQRTLRRQAQGETTAEENTILTLLSRVSHFTRFLGHSEDCTVASGNSTRDSPVEISLGRIWNEIILAWVLLGS